MIKTAILIMALQGIFPTYSIAKDVVATTTDAAIEAEIGAVKSLMSSSIAQFLRAKERYQLCTISLWMAGSMGDKRFVEYLETLGIEQFKDLCRKILTEMRAETRGAIGIDNLPAVSFFVMATDNLAIWGQQ